jgi:hypothetical protein
MQRFQNRKILHMKNKQKTDTLFHTYNKSEKNIIKGTQRTAAIVPQRRTT